jgi:hypothetical protein
MIKENPAISMQPSGMIDVLHQLGIKVTAAELKDPNVDVVLRIYKGMLEHCLQLNRDAFEMDPDDLTLHFDEQVCSKQTEAFRFIQVYIYISYMLDMIGLKLTFSQIFNAKRRSLNKQLQSLIEFSKFLISQIHEFCEVREENDKYLDKCEIVQREINDLEANIYSLKSDKNEKKNLVEMAKRRIATLRARRNPDERIRVTEQMQQLAKEEERLKAGEAEHLARMAITDKKMSLYDKILIKSPTRLKKDMGISQARTTELNKRIKTKTAEEAELKKNLIERENVVKSFATVRDSLQHFYESDIHTANELSKEKELVNAKVTNEKFELVQLQSMYSMSKEKKDSLAEMFEKSEIDYERTTTKLSEKFQEEEKKGEKFSAKGDELEIKMKTYVADRVKFKSRSEMKLEEAFAQLEENKQKEKLLAEVYQAKLRNMDSICDVRLKLNFKRKLDKMFDIIEF